MPTAGWYLRAEELLNGLEGVGVLRHAVKELSEEDDPALRRTVLNYLGTREQLALTIQRSSAVAWPASSIAAEDARRCATLRVLLKAGGP